MQPLLTFIRLIKNSIFNTIKFIICYFITVFTEDYDFDYGTYGSTFLNLNLHRTVFTKFVLLRNVVRR